MSINYICHRLEDDLYTGKPYYTLWNTPIINNQVICTNLSTKLWPEKCRQCIIQHKNIKFILQEIQPLKCNILAVDIYDVYFFKCQNNKHPIFTLTMKDIIYHKWCPLCFSNKGLSISQQVMLTKYIYKLTGIIIKYSVKYHFWAPLRNYKYNEIVFVFNKHTRITYKHSKTYNTYIVNIADKQDDYLSNLRCTIPCDLIVEKERIHDIENNIAGTFTPILGTLIASYKSKIVPSIMHIYQCPNDKHLPFTRSYVELLKYKWCSKCYLNRTFTLAAKYIYDLLHITMQRTDDYLLYSKLENNSNHKYNGLVIDEEPITTEVIYTCNINNNLLIVLSPKMDIDLLTYIKYKLKESNII